MVPVLVALPVGRGLRARPPLVPRRPPDGRRPLQVVQVGPPAAPHAGVGGPGPSAIRSRGPTSAPSELMLALLTDVLSLPEGDTFNT